MNERIGIIGVGYAIPANLRGNNDPVFDWLHAHPKPGQDLFAGYGVRPILSPQETLTDILVPAAQKAIDDAGLSHRDIDALIGQASVSDFVMPNALAHLHAELNLPRTAWVLPINNEYTNFPDGLVLADALIRAGRAKNVLVVCGCNWTRFMDYQTPQSVSAADGAGAAVVGRTSDASRFVLHDAETEVQSDLYGGMFMAADPVAPPPPSMPGGLPAQAYTQSYFHLTAAGVQDFLGFGEQAPPALANRVLARNGIKGSDIALISHQASSVLLDIWQKAIGPAQYLTSLPTFANMTLATIPVNLAHFYAQIETDFLMLLGIGAELQTTAVLLKRNG